jgi:hypothetical protein
MPRSSSLKPAHRPEREAKGLAPWCVNVPNELSDTGKRRQLFFDTKSEASTECEKLKARRDNFGVSLTAMTPARITEASEAYKLLDPLNVQLLDAVREYVETHKTRSASVPFSRLFDLFLEAKAAKSEKYKTQLRWVKERCAVLHDRLAADITVRDLDAVLQGEKATVRNAWMRYLRAVFNYGVKRDYLASNPVTKLDFAEVVKGDTAIFDPATVRAILTDCLKNDLALLPYRVIGFFAGVRPDRMVNSRSSNGRTSI